MKGIRFYLEYPNKKEMRRARPTKGEFGNHDWNVLAILTEYPPNPYYSGIGAVFFTENSPVGFTMVSYEHLRERTKRISESQAREIHPELFNYLEQ